VAPLEQYVDVAVPLGTAYAQWTRFEDLPRFMEGVADVVSADGTELRWRIRMQPPECDWEFEITEQRPDERVAWRSLTGLPHAGVVTFHPLDGASTRVTVMLDGETGTARETIEHNLKGSLRRFKALLESGRVATR
jgi:uncharacterized membrane protein